MELFNFGSKFEEEPIIRELTDILDASKTALSNLAYGKIEAKEGKIGGWLIGEKYLKSGYGTTEVGLLTEETAGDDVRIYAGGSTPSSAPFNVTESGLLTTSKIKITGLQTGSDLDGQYLTNNTVISAKVKPSLRGSSHDLVFSATDADTVAWATGTITLSDGTAYSIDAGNTGNMSARTYIYLDVDVSTTVLQTSTTFSDAVGDGKILIASAENGTGEATFYVVGGIGGINIDANSIIVANLAAIKADLGTITAGNITLDTSGYIKGGQTAYNTGTGFFLGYSTDAYKFSIGNPSGYYMTWNGTSLTVKGTAVYGAVFGAGDILASSADTERNFGDLSYTEYKQITVKKGGILRVKFDLKCTTVAGTTVYAKIYKNNVAVGTERSKTDDTNYETFSEDISGFLAGDTVELYCKVNTAPKMGSIRNFRIYVDNLEAFTVDTD